MLMHRARLIGDLLDKAREGYSLPQAFYTSPEVFAADMEAIVTRKWIVAGHVSQIPDKGDYFLFRIGGEQILILRENAETVRAFFNVCRHRGSTLCSAESGNAPKLVCPYHAWTFNLDGSLLSARLMPDDFNKAENGLHKCHVRVFHGLIFVNLSPDEPDDFDETFGAFDPILDYHGFADAKVVHIGRYPTAANWKLVVENFLECYHCTPAHPEFCSMHPPEALLAVGAGPSSGPSEAVAKYAPALEAWEKQAKSLGRPVYTIDDDAGSSHLRTLLQRSIRDGYLTETQDGQPAASLMGKRQDWDLGRMHAGFSPFSHIVADSDFAMLFRFTPRSSMQTDVDVIWLVDGAARDYDLDKMTWAWNTTTLQDKQITEDNQAGVLSSRYLPGRYSTQERALVTFQKWYLGHLEHA